MNPSEPRKEGRIVEQGEEHLPSGPAGAAILSCGIGCCALGSLAVIADASKTIARGLTWYRPTGPLSGVSSLAILVWLLIWFVLAVRWRKKTVALGKVLGSAFVFLALGILLTFPPFADLLLGK